MKTEPHARHHHEGEPPPESLIHHEEPTLLEQWLRRAMQRGTAFWGAVALIAAGLVAVTYLAYRVGGPDQATRDAWAELAAVGAPPAESPLAGFGPAPAADLPDRLREIAQQHPDTAPARWAKLRAATLLLNEGSSELATSRRTAGAGKVIEADELFAEVAESAEDQALRRMAALGLARAAEARLGLDADDPEHARFDDVLALYDRVIEDFPDTPEAEQATRLKRRLNRSDSRAFYEQLARFDPTSIPSAPGIGLPGLDLAPGASSPLQNLLNLPPISPSGTTPGLGTGLMDSPFPGLDLTPPSDVSTPSPTTEMPEPVVLPENTASPTEPEVPVAPSPDEPGAGAQPSAPAPESPDPAPAPAPESPTVPDNPFGDSSPATPAPAPETPVEAPAAGSDPEPGVTLPDDVFPPDGSNG